MNRFVRPLRAPIYILSVAIWTTMLVHCSSSAGEGSEETDPPQNCACTNLVDVMCSDSEKTMIGLNSGSRAALFACDDFGGSSLMQLVPNEDSGTGMCTVSAMLAADYVSCGPNGECAPGLACKNNVCMAEESISQEQYQQCMAYFESLERPSSVDPGTEWNEPGTLMWGPVVSNYFPDEIELSLTTLSLEPEGNLVLSGYNPNVFNKQSTWWASNTVTDQPLVRFQTDGNFCVYELIPEGGIDALWCAGTATQGEALQLNDENQRYALSIEGSAWQEPPTPPAIGCRETINGHTCTITCTPEVVGVQTDVRCEAPRDTNCFSLDSAELLSCAQKVRPNLTEQSPMRVQLWGAGGSHQSGQTDTSGESGFAQHVTTVSDLLLWAERGNSVGEIFYFLGDNTDAKPNPAPGGSSGLVVNINASQQANHPTMDDRNFLLIAGGGGGASGFDAYPGGVALSDPNADCGISTDTLDECLCGYSTLPNDPPIKVAGCGLAIEGVTWPGSPGAGGRGGPAGGSGQSIGWVNDPFGLMVNGGWPGSGGGNDSRSGGGGGGGWGGGYAPNDFAMGGLGGGSFAMQSTIVDDLFPLVTDAYWGGKKVSRLVFYFPNLPFDVERGGDFSERVLRDPLGAIN